MAYLIECFENIKEHALYFKTVIKRFIYVMCYREKLVHTGSTPDLNLDLFSCITLHKICENTGFYDLHRRIRVNENP